MNIKEISTRELWAVSSQLLSNTRNSDDEHRTNLWRLQARKIGNELMRRTDGTAWVA